MIFSFPDSGSLSLTFLQISPKEPSKGVYLGGCAFSESRIGLGCTAASTQSIVVGDFGFRKTTGEVVNFKLYEDLSYAITRPCPE